MAPVCVMLPPAVTPKVPLPIEEAPSTNVVLFTNDMLFAPELLSETAPVKLLLALLKVIAFAPALKLDNPGTVNAPV